jgi:hypothetical protein
MQLEYSLSFGKTEAERSDHYNLNNPQIVEDFFWEKPLFLEDKN